MPRGHTYRDRDRRTARRRTSDPAFSGWTGLGVGLAMGLAVAAFVWKFKSRPVGEPLAKTKNAAPLSAREEAAADKEQPSGSDFTFYEKLKTYEVVIPEREKDVHRDLKTSPETRPGSYILQAGSYHNYADADRVRAQLALAGVESKVQKVSVDTDTWHRVRIGPISNLDELNRLRARLREADVDALVIRVGD